MKRFIASKRRKRGKLLSSTNVSPIGFKKGSSNKKSVGLDDSLPGLLPPKATLQEEQLLGHQRQLRCCLPLNLNRETGYFDDPPCRADAGIPATAAQLPPSSPRRGKLVSVTTLQEEQLLGHQQQLSSCLPLNQ